MTGKVLLAIAGDLAANLELEPVGRLEISAVRVGQQLVVAVSPFRHRTTKLALTGYEMVAPGEQDRVVANCRRRLAEIKGGGCDRGRALLRLQPDQEPEFFAIASDGPPPSELGWSKGTDPPPDCFAAGPVAVDVDGPRRPLPDYLPLGELALVSGWFVAQVGALLAGSVQFFPATVRLDGGAILPGHSVMNVVGRLDCVVGEGRGATLAIPRRRAHGLPIFVLHPVPAVVVVGGQVAQALEGLTGVGVVELKGLAVSSRLTLLPLMPRRRWP